jgi:uncharacterized phage protein (TIGR01671 family)
MIPKFRAYSTEENEMYYPHNDKNVDWTIDDETGFIAPLVNLGDGMWGMIDKYELMQSTGLKDKNGVEVFEGDILHRKVHVILLGTDLNKWVDEYAHVEWKYGGWHVGEDLLEFVLEEGIDRHTGCSQTALEVIGNIYENPDLLDSDLVEVD